MIQLIVQRLERAPDIGKIDNPTFVRPDRAGDMNFDAKRMAMKTVTLVRGRHMRQPVSCLNGEDFEYFHERRVPCDGCVTPRERFAVSAKEGYASAQSVPVSMHAHNFARQLAT